MIKVEKLGCKSGHRYLLKDITWEVPPGEHWLVFGPNGSGKTTLLSIIAGFKQHTEGSIELFGNATNNREIIDARKRIGFVSASFFGRIYGNESALNIVLSGIFGALGVDGPVPLETVNRAITILREFNLEDRMNYPFAMFSKGEQQNILIARAIINDPDILILDEPCTGLDVYNREYLFETINALGKNKNLAIVYVTHYVEEVLPMFDKSLLLKGGIIFKQGATRDLLTSEVFTKYFEYPVTISQNDEGIYRLELSCRNNLTERLY